VNRTDRPVAVLIADDQTLFRSGLARLLDRDPRVAVVGEAVDGEDAVKLAGRLKPDVVLMDLKMPRLDGIEAARQIVALNPETKVLILTTFDTDAYVLEALHAGAGGYVLKDASPESMINSVLAVVAGQHVMDRSIAERMLGMLDAGRTKSSFNGLTAREIQILKLIASGLANKQVAYQLKISEKTVRNHISNIYNRLGIDDRSQAVLYAVRKGLIRP
jgi:DNA-binding NarL/FixJ family response regulator